MSSSGIVDFLDRGALKLHASSEFDGPLRHLIHSFKYKRQQRLGALLARRWLQSFSPIELPVDAVVCVPSTPLKNLLRGYNPAEEIAKEIAREWRVPLRGGIIRRRWLTASQTRFGRRQRFENAAQSFAPAATNKLMGQRVLLVDDVCTTGATLAICARILRQAGAKEIIAGTIARETLLR